MQEFFMDYGLYLLVGLLVIIALVFLLSGKKKGDDIAEPAAPAASVATHEPAPPPAPVPVIDPIVAAPVSAAPPVVEPTPIAAPPVAEPPVAKPPVVEPDVPTPSAKATPVAATTPPEPAPAPQPAPAATAATDGDDLLHLKGVGPKLKALLIDLGITRFAQIAAWTDSDIAAIDARLGTFKGRPVRDQWVDQARYLASGDIAGFEAKYGKI